MDFAATLPAARGHPSKMAWAGRVLSAVVVLFLIADGVVKFFDVRQVVESFVHLGYPPNLAPAVGTIGLLCAVLYCTPRTALLGTVLVTGLCGGAVASQLRIGSPLFTHVLFGVYVGILAWCGLWLRDSRVRALTPIRRAPAAQTLHPLID